MGPIHYQHAHLSAMMRGHYAYYGTSGNYRRLSWYADEVASIWKKWLSRRDRRKRFLWSRANASPPAAAAVHKHRVGGHEWTGVRAHEQHQFADLLGLAEAAHRHVFQELLFSSALVAAAS